MKAASKGLFVFHPHGRVSEEVLDEDFANHKEMAWSHSLHKREIELSDDARLSEETRLSDYCICASEFTANSIRTISENKPLFVVPYGCFPPRDLSHRERPFTDVLRYLFVGQGVQRKGIHHLIKVWRRGPNRRRVLTIVGSKMDPAVLSLASDCKDSIVFKRGLTKKELELEYEQADIFVLPSLVEGFGLVYLEALSAGCFVIGTTNTGLPDLQVPSSVASVIKAGDLCQLEEALNSAAETVRAPSFDRSLIKAFAATRSWDRFREGIRSALRTIDAI